MNEEDEAYTKNFIDYKVAYTTWRHFSPVSSVTTTGNGFVLSEAKICGSESMVSFQRSRRDSKPWYVKRDITKNLGDPCIPYK